MADIPAVTAVRDHLVQALEHDLVGPFALDERLPLPPSRWYLTGFLAPQTARDLGDPTADEELGAGSDQDDEETVTSQGSEPEPRQKNRLPASLGLSVLLPPTSLNDAVRATVSWADYAPEPGEHNGKSKALWRRAARGPVTIEVVLDQATLTRGVEVPGSGGLRLRGKVEAVTSCEAQGLVPGTRALSLFLVNERPVGERGRQDEMFAFQVALELEHEHGFVPRPNRRDESSEEWDERVADLQFRERCELAVGHGVSTDVPDCTEPVRRVRTTWLPRAEVRRVETRDEPAVTTSVEALAALADGKAARLALVPLVEAYAAWIEAQQTIDVGSAVRTATRDELLRRADVARARIAEGVELLATDAEAFEAFRIANRAVAMAMRQRSAKTLGEGWEPRWRLFQLAFVVMNLPGLTRDAHPDRDTVELIFFPTGGGKTEAYLGLIAYTLVLRRLRGQGRADRGLGVAVLLRYTLRLLTLDQLGRAATLICALELIRREQPEKLGDVRFAVGLWVGRSATANTMEEIAKKVVEYKNSASKAGSAAGSPMPLTHCPWCGKELGRDSLTLEPPGAHPDEVLVGCLDFKCPFSRGKNRDGLPVLFVDEQIYRELPCFVVATVDKFAMMPWRGEVGLLFGRAQARDGRHFFGPLDKIPRAAARLPEGTALLPPELIVQDELHLISGPLGTMVGLYETAIETLCTRTMPDGSSVKPKIVASTATARRAGQQVRALFGRSRTAIFPPPGIDDSETWFATVDRDEPGRLYVGVAAPGRAMKALLLRTYVDLLAGAQKVYDPAGPPEQTADGSMTLVGYFNSLRELGGMRRLVEDEVRSRCAEWSKRVPMGFKGSNPWFASRAIQMEPVELTSREPTHRIAESKARLAKPLSEKDHVDVVLASNMISVGVDIERLALMVVAGQPKTTAEYIQASSRVGRQARWPGLVVTCFNLHKPRDRSHYERFATYHESFYRFVEAQSLTPFSGPALERGLAGTLVAMTRLADPLMTEPEAAMLIDGHREAAEKWVDALARRAGAQPGVDGDRERATTEAIAARCRNLLDAWETLVREARDGAAKRSYSRFDKDRSAGKPLLHYLLDEDQPVVGSDEAKFTAPTSMRDVEPTVHLWIERRALGGGGKH